MMRDGEKNGRGQEPAEEDIELREEDVTLEDALDDSVPEGDGLAD